MICEGTNSYGGLCNNPAAFLIRTGTRQYARVVAACGRHLAQQVEQKLRDTNCVEVEKADD